MLRHLTRQASIDRTWGTADLNEAADYWLHLYRAADRKARFRATPFHAVEVRLRGFPRQRGEAVEAEVQRRLTVGPLDAPRTARPDPDTVAFGSGYLSCEGPPPEGLLLSLLAGAPFDGLLAEVRFTVAGFRGTPAGRAKVEATLVLVGELRGGRLTVKAVWRAGAFDRDSSMPWNARWGDEAVWLAGLEEFRKGREVPKRLAARWFPGRFSDWLGMQVARLILTPFDRPRLGGLLGRLLFFTLAVTVLALPLARFWGQWQWLERSLLLFPLGIVGTMAGLFVAYELFLLVHGYRLIRRGYSRAYASPARLVPLTGEEAVARLAHPWADKALAECRAPGWEHLGDLRLDPEETGAAVYRVFRAADGVTYVQVLLQQAAVQHDGPGGTQQLWPAMWVLAAHTALAGGACRSVSGALAGFRRKRSGAEVCERVFADETDPAAFLRLHQAAAEAHARAARLVPEPAGGLDDFLRRQEEWREAERQQYAARPYGVSDHLRWWLQVRRHEYHA